MDNRTPTFYKPRTAFFLTVYIPNVNQDYAFCALDATDNFVFAILNQNNLWDLLLVRSGRIRVMVNLTHKQVEFQTKDKIVFLYEENHLNFFQNTNQIVILVSLTDYFRTFIYKWYHVLTVPYECPGYILTHLFADDCDTYLFRALTIRFYFDFYTWFSNLSYAQRYELNCVMQQNNFSSYGLIQEHLICRVPLYSDSVCHTIINFECKYLCPCGVLHNTVSDLFLHRCR